mmetsp:Transcript_74787/g.67250  ORF Transcript_74787/g.67250 Transcript_74787/m.67250 type:complete len:287 (+) Transcript_74787:20-880(+)
MAAEAKQDDNYKGKNVKFEVSKNVGLDTILLTQKLSEEAIKDHGSFRIAVSGGSFSKNFAKGLEELIKSEKNNIDFSKWKVFLADERCVDLENDDSNYKGFKGKFMEKAKDIKLENVFPINSKLIKLDGDDEAKNNEKMCVITEEICDSYLKDILAEFNIDENNKDNIIPSFDCIYLGMGGDGHTASLFPDHQLLNSKKLVDFITNSPKPPPFRITLTLPLICNAKNIIFVVTGKAKQDAIKQISEINNNNDDNKKQTLPSGMVTEYAKGNVVWILDDDAAATAKL